MQNLYVTRARQVFLVNEEPELFKSAKKDLNLQSDYEVAFSIPKRCIDEAINAKKKMKIIGR